MERISSKVVVEKLAEIKRLPHMPEVLLELNRLLASPNGVHVNSVAKLIMQDARLTAGLLKVVNSAKYQMGKPIDNLVDAIARLGVNDLRVMALAINYGEAFSVAPLLDREKFLNHGLLAAHIGAILAKSPRIGLNPYYGFMIGLMHEIGIYLLLQCAEVDYPAVVEGCRGRVISLVAVENKQLGFSHSNVGARLLKIWGFPEPVYMGVLGHHAPNMLDAEHQLPASVGFLAEAAAFYLQGSNGVVEGDVGKLSDAVIMVLARLGITEDEFKDLIEQGRISAKEAGVVC